MRQRNIKLNIKLKQITFKADEKLIWAFKSLCAAEQVTMSDTLTDFVDKCVKDKKIPEGVFGRKWVDVKEDIPYEDCKEK